MNLGPYVLLDRLGEGGMGEVWRARHERLGTLAALKVVRAAKAGDPGAARRFVRELRALAALKHPHIVQALDAGEQDGDPWLAMELVEGIDLSRLVRKSGPLPLPQACDCVRQAALGLQHAHEKGYVHRDIKPSNLLLSANGVVKVLDFGLALNTDATDESSTLTGTGAVMGTPDYVAPEQILDCHGADIRADVYSLGCTLYFLLTGQVPFPGGSLGAKLVRHQTSEPEPLEALRPEVPASLASLVRKMMAKSPADRFAAPGEVAEALASLQADGDLERGAWGGLTRGPAAKHRSFLGAALSITAVLALVAGVAAWWLTRPVPEPPAHAPSEARSEMEKLSPKDIPEEERAGLPPEAIRVLGTRHGRHWGRVRHVLWSEDGKRILTAGEDQVIRVWDGETLRETAVLQQPAQSLGWTRIKGKAVLAACWKQSIHLWDAATLQPLDPIKLPCDAGVVSPCGRYAIRSIGVPLLVEIASGREIASFKDAYSKTWTGAAFTEDGGKALLAVKDAVVVLDAATGKESGRLRCSGRAERIAVAAGRVLVTDSAGDTVLHELESSRVVERLASKNSPDTLHSPSLSADGASAVVPVPDRDSIRLWKDGRQRLLAMGNTRLNVSAFRPDGRRVLLADNVGRLRLWDLETGKLLRESRGTPHAACFLGDGSRVAASYSGGLVVVWDLATGKPLSQFDLTPRSAVALAADAEGTRLGLVCETSECRVTDVSGKEAWKRTEKPSLGSVAFSADGRLLYAGILGSDQAPAGEKAKTGIFVFDAATGAIVDRLAGHAAPVNGLALSPDGTRLASASGLLNLGGNEVRVRELSTGKEVVEPMPQHVERVAWSRDGKRIASGGQDGNVFLWDQGKPPVTCRVGGFVRSLGFSGDGLALAVDNAGRLVSIDPSGKIVADRRFPGPISALAVSPDGKHLLTANANGTCWLLRLPLRAGK